MITQQFNHEMPMRRFRIWDYTTQQMLYDEQAFNLLHLFIQNSFINKRYNQRNKNLYLMDYLDLRDVNGKEIYEDDILSLPNGIEGVVRYRNGSYGILIQHHEDFSESFMSNIPWQYSRVASNIHEENKNAINKINSMINLRLIK